MVKPKHCSFYPDSELKSALREYAFHHNLSLSKAACTILWNFLKDEKKTKKRN